jgi:hypothetical protein
MERTSDGDTYQAPEVSDLGRLEELTKSGTVSGAKEGKNMKT